MCRQYDDLGSFIHGCAEHNLNSLNFPEFHKSKSGDKDKDESQAEEAEEGNQRPQCWLESAKSHLFFLAEYERKCLTVAREQLALEIDDAQLLQALNVLISSWISTNGFSSRGTSLRG